MFRIGYWIVWPLWQAVRWAVLALLIILEPVVRLALSVLPLLGVGTALLMRFAIQRPGFPFLGTLAFCGACIAVLALYYAAIRALSNH